MTSTTSSPWGHPVCPTCGGFLPDSCICDPWVPAVDALKAQLAVVVAERRRNYRTQARKIQAAIIAAQES
jgi:hypothetical protein